MSLLEIIDEAGNVHGPFETTDEMMRCVEDRGLGEQRDPDDDIGRGWYMRAARTHDEGKLNFAERRRGRTRTVYQSNRNRDRLPCGL